MWEVDGIDVVYCAAGRSARGVFRLTEGKWRNLKSQTNGSRERKQIGNEEPLRSEFPILHSDLFEI
jgi:hypothetical protein